MVILFFFSHWKSYKILVRNTHETSNRFVVQDSKQLDERSNVESERNESKCRSEGGLQTSGHCVNKGMLGVAPSDMANYQPNPMGLFACLDGEMRVGWASMNDDFCDCSDGSDEPGTGACPNTRFFCVGGGHYLLSSRINDGICDCCDGSDEWKKLTVRADVLQKHNFNIKYVPCGNSCWPLLYATSMLVAGHRLSVNGDNWKRWQVPNRVVPTNQEPETLFGSLKIMTQTVIYIGST